MIQLWKVIRQFVSLWKVIRQFVSLWKVFRQFNSCSSVLQFFVSFYSFFVSFYSFLWSWTSYSSVSVLFILKSVFTAFYDHKQVFLIPQTQRQTQSLANPGFGQLWRWLESLIPKQDQRVKFSQGRVEWLGVRITVFINICSEDILSQSHYITSLSTSPDSLPTNSHIKTRGWRSIKVYHINWSLSHTVKQTAMCFAWLSRIHNLQPPLLHVYIYICI